MEFSKRGNKMNLTAECKKLEAKHNLEQEEKRNEEWKQIQNNLGIIQL